jgi:putative SOS response-associated peptidase YedK
MPQLGIILQSSPGRPRVSQKAGSPKSGNSKGEAVAETDLRLAGTLLTMCGRFAMDKKLDDLVVEFIATTGRSPQEFRTAWQQEWEPTYSIAPTDTIPIIRERRHADTGEVVRMVDPARWDFHPAFMKEANRPNFNARIETVATNGLWKGAFTSSRCIVPIRGYYEWSEQLEGTRKVKQPHFIHGATDILAAAGIYTARKVGGEWVVSAAIITREARDASGKVHERMPVFLTNDVHDEWLSPTKLETDAEKQHTVQLLHEVSGQVASTITTYEVDRRVNSQRAIDPRDPTLIDQVA